MKINEFGRSMIEMLGVLVIVGILSVGGIAGFSKAMMKYKLNKQTEQIVSIMNYARLNIDTAIFKSLNQSMNATKILAKAGAFPGEMIIEGQPDYLKDIFGNIVLVKILGGGTFELVVNLNKNKLQSCIKLVLLAKQYSSNLWRVKFTEDQVSFWGDKMCTKNMKCLRDVNITEILDSCRACDTVEICTFWFQEKF